MICCSSEDKSQSTEVASENCELADKSLLGGTTHRLFAAYNLAELTAGNQPEQKYAVLRTAIFPDADSSLS